MFVGSTNNLEGNLGSFFSLDAIMRFNSKDGYYYNIRNIRYTCSGSEGYYTYIQVVSILEPYKEENCLIIPDTNAMVELVEYMSTIEFFTFRD